MEWLASANSNAWNIDRFPVADVSLLVIVKLIINRSLDADKNSYDSFKVFLGLPTTGH